MEGGGGGGEYGYFSEKKHYCLQGFLMEATDNYYC